MILFFFSNQCCFSIQSDDDKVRESYLEDGKAGERDEEGKHATCRADNGGASKSKREEDRVHVLLLHNSGDIDDCSLC